MQRVLSTVEIKNSSLENEISWFISNTIGDTLLIQLSLMRILF
ncbi:MAG: hypothetical protein CM15mP107_1620 [Bacteroidota bacterium]|nr:MAG: hypothetical protein CM15mP107_1620 [Bacteroidota bacterium]